MRRTALPFRLHAAVSCPPPAELATSLAWELGDLDADRVERAPAALAPAELEREPVDQLRALGDTVSAGALCARPGTDPEALLIDRVLERGHGHALVVAVVLAELGRRAGLPIGIVGGERGHFVAHQRLAAALVLDPTTGALVDARELGVLQWRCGHQVAAELLDILEPRYERCDDLARAVGVARLRCALPFDDMTDAEQRLRRLTARLN